jgi:hypothetical protein
MMQECPAFEAFAKMGEHRGLLFRIKGIIDIQANLHLDFIARHQFLLSRHS